MLNPLKPVLLVALVCAFAATSSLIAQDKPVQSGVTHFQRMQMATLADGDPDGIVFTVSGIIQDSDGKPVPDAIVVLLEGSTYRISSKIQPRPIETYRENYLVNDVFARTTSDQSGRYEFKNVAAPAVSDRFSRSWNWSVAASNSTGDFGWRRIKTGYEGPETIELDGDVDLRASLPISGTVLSVEGKPVADAVISLSSLRRKDYDRLRGRSPEDFDGNASSLQLFSTTGADGTFRFPTVPVDQAASVMIRHPGYEFKLTQIVSGESQTIQAVPRVVVRGEIVDESGSPIAGARFTSDGSSAYTTTDDKGRFAWPTTEESLMRISRSKSPAEAKAAFFASVPNSDFIRLGINVSIVELLAGKDRTIVLQRGCRVSGKVVTSQSIEPVEGATVTANLVDTNDVLNLSITRTDSEGAYELVVQRKLMSVGISGSVAGFLLPRTDYRDGLKNESEYVRHIDLTGKENVSLDDFVVEALPAINVTIVDENEQAVEKASVTAFYQQRQGTRNRLSVERDLASAMMTDGSGQCRLLPTVKTWDLANVRARANIDGAVWFGTQRLAPPTKNAPSLDPIKIQLQKGWKLSGRVLIDGKPASGVNVALMRRIENGLNSMTAITSKYTDRTTTDRNGNYTFIVAPNETYSASVTGPNDSRGRSSSQSLEKISDHEYRFRDVVITTPDASGDPNGKVSGRVVDFDWNPIADAQITSYSRGVGAPAKTDTKGNFEVKGLPDGQVRLHVYWPGRDKNKTANAASVTATVGDSDLTIRIDRRLSRVQPRLEVKRIVKIDPNDFPNDTGDATIVGKVLDLDDQPIAGAVVRINAAKRRPIGGEIAAKIRSTQSHPECGKLAVTDGEGHFQIENVSADLLYEVAVGATGYLGNLIRDFDPAQPSRNVNMAKMEPAEPQHTVSARIIDRYGKGIPGATIEVSPVIYMEGRVRGPDAGITSATVSDSDGKFRLRVVTPIRRMTLKIRAGGFAAVANNSAKPGRPLQDIQLSHGSSLDGRLVIDGKPAAGVKLELVQWNRSIGNIVTPMPTTTDAEGRFRWNHLDAVTEYAIYSLMDQDADASLPATLVKTDLSGTLADLGDVPVKPGHRVILRFITEDRKPIPPRAYCYLSRSKAWTSGRKSLPEKFAPTVRFNSVPSEVIGVYVRVPDYEVIKVEPECQIDLNRRYAFYCDEDKSFTFTLRPVATP